MQSKEHTCPVCPEYPYVVVRFMAAVYGRRAVLFHGEQPSLSGNRPVVVPTRRPTNGQCSLKLRQQIALSVLADVQRSKLRMCCVFGPSDCVFVEPDGSFNAGNEPPSGGVRLEAVKKRQRSLDTTPLRRALEDIKLTDHRVSPACIAVDDAGYVSMPGGQYFGTATQLGRLQRLAKSAGGRDDGAVILRTRGEQLVGAVSTAYVSVSHLELVDAIDEVLGETGFALHKFDGDYHQLRIILIDASHKAEAKVGDVSHGGIEITNSETGRGPITVCGYLYRLACANGTVLAFPLERRIQPHRGGSSRLLVERFREAVETCVDELKRHLWALRTLTQKKLLPGYTQQVRARLSAVLSETSTDRLFEELPSNPTVYDLYNAVTHRAHRRNLVRRRGIEIVGGEILRDFVSLR